MTESGPLLGILNDIIPKESGGFGEGDVMGLHETTRLDWRFTGEGGDTKPHAHSPTLKIKNGTGQVFLNLTP